MNWTYLDSWGGGPVIVQTLVVCNASLKRRSWNHKLPGLCSKSGALLLRPERHIEPVVTLFSKSFLEYSVLRTKEISLNPRRIDPSRRDLPWGCITSGVFERAHTRAVLNLVWSSDIE